MLVRSNAVLNSAFVYRYQTSLDVTWSPDISGSLRYAYNDSPTIHTATTRFTIFTCMLFFVLHCEIVRSDVVWSKTHKA